MLNSQFSSDILVISLDNMATPSIALKLPPNASGNNFCRGIGWFPGDQQVAMTSKAPVTGGADTVMSSTTDSPNFRSSLFFYKIGASTSGFSHKTMQPFTRSYAGRDWMFMHNGELDRRLMEELHDEHTQLVEPLGNSSSEVAFCNLIALVQKNRYRQLSDLEPAELLSWFQRFDLLGGADMVFTDSSSIVCYHGKNSNRNLFYTRLQPPNNQGIFESAVANIELNDPRDAYRTVFIISSSPWVGDAGSKMQLGQMVIARRGMIVWDSLAKKQDKPAPIIPIASSTPAKAKEAPELLASQQKGQKEETQAHTLVTNVRSITQTPQGEPLAYRSYEITHTTLYEYETPVLHSTHYFRLRPFDDPIQEVVKSSLTTSMMGEEIQFEDVFGNHSLHYSIDKPYTQLEIKAYSKVNVFSVPPDDYSLSRRRTTIPLVWMPWQRQMMMPYLLPPELPEPQLLELTDYAMSFVERNDYQLIETLQDINESIYRDFKYMPSSTSLNTTPFEVYFTREGVCQDFANLFICLARLLGIPARYRIGYIYTGGNYANKIQSEASHAWLEVYLPYVGWRGFDPTNGCYVGQDHVRVACGRNYIDATPTSGTIYKGGAAEKLSVDVKMTFIDS